MSSGNLYDMIYFYYNDVEIRKLQFYFLNKE